jgi:hypothetical protein
MNNVSSVKLTVYFEEPFWVGIFERCFGDKYEVAKIVFGAEPKDFEVYDIINSTYYDIPFGRASLETEISNKKINPKRLQKKIKDEVNSAGVGTKAQIAMKLQIEAKKVERKKTSKEIVEEDKRRKFEQKQQKKREKHKGH